MPTTYINIGFVAGETFWLATFDIFLLIYACQSNISDIRPTYTGLTKFGLLSKSCIIFILTY